MTPELELIQKMIRTHITGLWERKKMIKDELEFVSDLPNENLDNIETEEFEKSNRLDLNNLKVNKVESGSAKSIVDILHHWCSKINAKIQNKSITEADSLKLKKILDIIYIENKL